MNEAGKSSMVFRFDEKSIVQGQLDIVIKRKGVVIEESGRNLVVDGGREALAKLLGGQTGFNITQIVVGSEGIEPAPSDTLSANFKNTFKKAISAVSFPVPGQVQFSFVLSEADANGISIRQFGLVCANGSTLFAHRTRGGKTIDKDSDISIEGKWTIYF